ncbi:Uncharacterised protein [Mycobacteroides abscessus subsp. abscessus]|nr:Uncharacterised protein [Mycobacteroides abscessus subsp. abscessus]
MLTESQFREIADTLKTIANELRDMNDRTTLKACVDDDQRGVTERICNRSRRRYL